MPVSECTPTGRRAFRRIFSARNSAAPAPLERKRTQDLCVLTRRSAAPRTGTPRESTAPAPFQNAMRRIFPRAIQRLPRRSKGNGHRTYAYSRAVQQPRAPEPPANRPPQRPFKMRCGAFFRAQFSGSRAARKETDTGLMRTHAPFSSPPRRKPPRAAPSAHAVRLGIAVHGSHAAPPMRSHAPFERRLTHADSPVWKPTKHFSQRPFRCIPYRRPPRALQSERLAPCENRLLPS